MSDSTAERTDEYRGFAVDDDGEPQTCSYCGVVIPSARLDMDHFPIPGRCGGTTTARACIVCDDLTDPLAMRHMPIKVMAAVMEDFQKLSRYSRICIAKVLVMGADMESRHGAEKPTDAGGAAA